GLRPVLPEARDHDPQELQAGRLVAFEYGMIELKTIRASLRTTGTSIRISGTSAAWTGRADAAPSSRVQTIPVNRAKRMLGLPLISPVNWLGRFIAGGRAAAARRP
ncbi:MAG: hypothetical protein AB7F22_08500, partial [Reyranella sp.]|uniref:hypothetical protein n=1 Tax=Reyranella sp. TaxID=1929291 RepID=UPI003D0C50F8